MQYGLFYMHLCEHSGGQDSVQDPTTLSMIHTTLRIQLSGG
jgi:hypothetical protein